MRWILSRTASSGRPTSTTLGSPAEVSTSTSTGAASIPTRAKVFSFASIGERLPKRYKRTTSRIQHTVPLRPATLPDGSRREGCQRYVVQDLRLVLHNTCYLLERWRTPDGQFLVGQLPPGVRTLGHFGLGLRTLVL